jgi:4-hydroxybenzoate polyprenyltransferase
MKLKSYLKLCRVSNLPTVWTNVLAALVLSGSFLSGNFLLLALSLSLFYSGGMCLNDFFDAEPDRLSKPFRPIPSGEISVRNAGIFSSVLLGSGLFILLLLPHPAGLFPGLLLLVLIFAYDLLHKKNPASIFLMASCRFMVFIIAAISVTGEIGNIVLIAAAVQFFYILLISITAKYENGSHFQNSQSVIPFMIAGISVLDGIMMAAFSSPVWMAAGIAGGVLTITGQKFVRGD